MIWERLWKVKSKKHYPKNNNETPSKISVKKEQIEMYQGPIPHPDTLRKYEEISPGFADRIIRMTEDQLHHRVELENKVIDSKIKDSRLGMILGFILSLITIGIGAYLIVLGKDVIGFSLVIGNLASLVVAFIYATNSNRKEREEKEK